MNPQVRGLALLGPKSKLPQGPTPMVDWAMNLNVGLGSTFDLTSFMNHIGVSE